MLKLAFAIGIYSYVVLFLGLIGQLYFFPIFLVTIFLIIYLLLNSKRSVRNFIKIFKEVKIDKKTFLSGVLFIILVFVNLIGALGPELGFDALWYHLTIPKLFVNEHSVYFIRDNLFYYSLMPKLAEMLYAASLILGNEIIAKLIHFAFGILSCIFLYKIARLYLSKNYSLLAVLVFYSNLVVDWLSITAYIDLIRVFYEVGALFYFLYFLKLKKERYLIFSAIMLGFSISTKLVSLMSLPVFVVLILLLPFNSLKSRIRNASLFSAISLFIALPWFLIAFYYTHNPIYPLFTHLGNTVISLNFLNPIAIFRNHISVFLFSADPISPFYIIMLPLFFFCLRSIIVKYRPLLCYCIFSYVFWYVAVFSKTFPVEGSSARFLTSYLPAYSVLGVIIMKEFNKRYITKIVIGLVALISLSSIFYRGVANFRFIPVIFGQQTKQEFLMKNLNFSFGDFYDEDGSMRKIVNQEQVLLVNMHNLYYVDFPFSLTTKDNQKPKYILVQNSNLPNAFKNATLIYKNQKTHVELYKL